MATLVSSTKPTIVVPPGPAHDGLPESLIFGRSEAMQQLRQRLERVPGTNVPVLIRGESGTGKEIISRLIHRLSPWSAGPFVKVSCPAIPGTLLESELFGYEEGAFTGANAAKPGRVELANRGTLFLDEIGELDQGLQAKLLQVLQDGQFCRIGAQEERRLEARVVCATNRDLEREVESGDFRQDLFYRINVITITLPPLRERAEDLPEMIEYFIATFNAEYNCRARALSPHLVRRLQAYHWPGNIRELENLIKRYVILGVEDAVTNGLEQPTNGHAFEPEIAADGTVCLKTITRHAVREVERKVILKVLESKNWHRKDAAKALNISYRALLYKIRDAGLSNARHS